MPKQDILPIIKNDLILDDWQKEILADEHSHILLAKGRRIGATRIFAIKAVEWLRKKGMASAEKK